MVFLAILLFILAWLIGRDDRIRQQRLEDEAWERMTHDPEIWLGSLIRSPGTAWKDSRRVLGEDQEGAHGS